jgi:hypothetical protein
MIGGPAWRQYDEKVRADAWRVYDGRRAAPTRAAA